MNIRSTAWCRKRWQTCQGTFCEDSLHEKLIDVGCGTSDNKTPVASARTFVFILIFAALDLGFLAIAICSWISLMFSLRDVAEKKSVFLKMFMALRTHNAAVALSGEGVVSSYSVEATGLVSRHGSEFGTLMATQSCGLETVAQAILGALKSLQRRSKAGHWQHSSFATVYQQLASSQLLPIFAAQRALQEFRI